MLDRADCADFGCHNSIRLETKHFLNTLALTFISFSGRFVFASDPLVATFTENVKNQKYLTKTQTVRDRALSSKYLTHRVVQEYPMLNGKRFGELWPTFESVIALLPNIII